MKRKIYILSWVITLSFLIGIPTVAFAKYQYGSIILSKHENEMKSAKVDLVVFPHWVHNMWFSCKICHEKPYEMEKGTTDISMKQIKNGEMCGTCHNGTLAFSHTECKRCHSLTAEAAMTLKTGFRTARLYPSIFTKKITKGKEKPTSLKFTEPGNVAFSEYKSIADKFNVQWDKAYFEKNGFPKDKLKIIDWEKLFFIDKAIVPISSLDGKDEAKVRKNVIVFDVLSDYVDDCVFNHEQHSTIANCTSCHDKVFKPVLSGNNVHMRRLADGEFCGHCHAKVSFPLATCVRCHTHEDGAKIDYSGEVLFRNNPLRGKKLSIARGSGLSIGGEKSIEQKKADNESTAKVAAKLASENRKKKSVLASIRKTPAAVAKKTVIVKKAQQPATKVLPEIKTLAKPKPPITAYKKEAEPKKRPKAKKEATNETVVAKVTEKKPIEASRKPEKEVVNEPSIAKAVDKKPTEVFPKPKKKSCWFFF